MYFSHTISILIMTQKPLILVTNDDGINAPGIRTLISVMNTIGDVVVVAPDSPQSGMGHAITLDATLYSKHVHLDNGPQKEFSCSGTPADCDFEASKPFVKKITEHVLKHGLPNGVVLNVNIPNIASNDIKGIKVCRQAKANWVEAFDKRKTPQGKDYYWLTGTFVNLDGGDDTDEWALENNYVSVVPTQFDLTAHHFIKDLNNWNL